MTITHLPIHQPFPDLFFFAGLLSSWWQKVPDTDFPNFSLARDGHVTQSWPMRCKRSCAREMVSYHVFRDKGGDAKEGSLPLSGCCFTSPIKMRSLQLLQPSSGYEEGHHQHSEDGRP